jgi:hypothetical protein
VVLLVLVEMEEVAREAQSPLCCVLLVSYDHEPCGCADTGHLTECSSGSSSGIHRAAHVCALWRGASVCMHKRKSFRIPHMSAHPPQSPPQRPGSPVGT